jgi:hypothetical protein
MTTTKSTEADTEACEVCSIEIELAEPERSICGEIVRGCAECVVAHQAECNDCIAQERDALDD